MKIALVALLLAVVVAGAWAVVYLGPDVRFSDEELREFGFVPYPEPRDVGDFALVDAAGGVFDAERLHGRWSFMFFGFANCPDICPITMTVLGEAERLLLDAGDEPFQGIMVSVDPERDTATALAEYVQAFSGNFVGVTGSAPDIYAFARSVHVGFSKSLVDSELGYVMNHSGHIVVVDPSGRHYGNISSPFEATRLATLYRALASRGPANT
ncbi:MAG: SCO family protein [Gammaproteobacteria bacterium]|nr:SCO family protein [Gammaproteobacteria bacterium]